MRVITGTARGKHLETLGGEEIVRPTAEKVKEAIFSSIQFKIAGAKTLDLFAGCGQLGIEALSRGASVCTFIDSSRDATAVVVRNLKSTGLFSSSRVITSDSIRYLAHCKDEFDIIFVDPPYNKGIVNEALELMSGVLSDGGLIICETEHRCELPELSGELRLHKRYKYGKTAVTVYEKLTDRDDVRTGEE
ncbi:MAG: 16S rRNA (guanine(966)-N(2))-methyltransferase RsmD [Oscillospiraceae bacterium]